VSIIYDALKKVEESTGKTLTGEPAPKKEAVSGKFKTYWLYGLVILAGLFLGNIFFGLLTNLKTPAGAGPKAENITTPLLKPQAPPPLAALPQEKQQALPAETSAAVPPLPEEKPLPSFTLNGIFFAQEEGYALVNNQIVKVGDTVDGSTVKTINSDSVELDSAGTVIRLSTRER
jgi:hypothetical protein